MTSRQYRQYLRTSEFLPKTTEVSKYTTLITVTIDVCFQKAGQIIQRNLFIARIKECPLSMTRESIYCKSVQFNLYKI